MDHRKRDMCKRGDEDVNSVISFRHSEGTLSTVSPFLSARSMMSEVWGWTDFTGYREV